MRSSSVRIGCTDDDEIHPENARQATTLSSVACFMFYLKVRIGNAVADVFLEEASSVGGTAIIATCRDSRPPRKVHLSTSGRWDTELSRGGLSSADDVAAVS